MARTILNNCSVIDGACAGSRTGQAIAIRGDRIEQVCPAGEFTAATDDHILDMDGMYVLPGLWDMHVHLSFRVMKSAAETRSVPADSLFSHRRALAYLTAGVTSLRLVGSPHDGADYVLRDGINSGEYPGPRILTAGPGIAATGGHGYRGAAGCDGPYEFRRAARKILWEGADLIKIMVTGGMGGRYESFMEAQTQADEVRAAIEVAHNAGKHVAAHVASPEAAVMCSRAGLDTVEHGYALDRESLLEMKANNTAFVPTLVVTDDQTYWEGHGVVSWAMNKIRQARPFHRRAAQLAMENGVRIAVGTDLPTAYTAGTICTVREMEVLTELGASPSDVIRWATLVPAEICGLADEAGSIAAGKTADLIAVSDDPQVSISSLRNVGFVMARGLIARDEIPGHRPVGLPPGFLPADC